GPEALAGDKAQTRRCRVDDRIIEVLVGSIVAPTDRIDQRRPQYLVQLNGGILPARLIELIGNGTAIQVGEHVSIFVEAVSEEDPRFFADLMIYAGHKIIFLGSSDGRGKENSRAVSEVRLGT